LNKDSIDISISYVYGMTSLRRKKSEENAISEKEKEMRLSSPRHRGQQLFPHLQVFD
jgi:hypothetical protein